MSDFVLFLGRFHVLALHVPIGIVVAAVALDWIARRERHRQLAAAAPLLWGGAAISAIVTAVLGYLHFAEGTFEGPSASLHRLYGTSVAVVATLAWWLRVKRKSAPALHLAAGALVLALVTLTGHYGGNLTHGSTYLAEYAPTPLRALAGLDARRERVTDPAALRAADSATLAALVEAGFLVREVAQSDPQLIVGVASPGTVIGPDQVAALLAAAKDIVELNLQDSGLEDRHLAGFGQLAALQRLRVSNNRVTDQGLRHLEGLARLEYLNLYGNPGVTDAGLDSLARIGTLRDVYVWQTGISAEGASTLRARRPDLVVQAGSPAFLPPASGGARDPSP